MCGLAGFVGPDSLNKQNIVEQMTDAISHRGPDDSSVKSYSFSCVGFNRLSIIDLSAKANQPFKLDKIIVYCNGEIYNYEKLRKEYNLDGLCHSNSDVEIIPHLYKKHGLDFLCLLNGMFAMVIIDEGKEEVHFITDRYGKKPIYYTQRNDGFYFASELKCFLTCFSDNEIDKQALATAFGIGLFPLHMTPVENVSKLLPANILTVRKGVVSRRQWYKLVPDYSRDSLSDAELEKHYYDCLDDSVRLRLIADVDVGVFMSGGIDSTSVVESAQRQYKTRMHAFSGIVAGCEESTDYKNATRFAKSLNVTAHPCPINSNTYSNMIVPTCYAFDEIPFETAIVNFMVIAKEAKKYVTVVLDGVGGDEIFLGYPWHERISRVPLWMRSLMPFAEKSFQKLFKKSPRNFLRSLVFTDVKKFVFFGRRYLSLNDSLLLSHYNPVAFCDLLDTALPEYANGFKDGRDLNCLAYLELLGMRNQQHRFSDRTCMAYSIENRSPLSDYRLAEMFGGTNEKRKLTGGKKGLMRKISTRLPQYITSAEKDGFSSPVYLWLKSDPKLLGCILKYINGKNEIISDLIGSKVVKKIVSRWKCGENVGWMDGVQLHMILCILIWYELYFVRKITKMPEIDLVDFIHS